MAQTLKRVRQPHEPSNTAGDCTPPTENPIHTRQCVAIPMRVDVGFDSVFGYGGQESQKRSRVDILKCWLDTQRGNFTVAKTIRQA